MNYTVKKLATFSGVSIRTLRFYDEIGLLKPAFIGENGYRYYQEPQVLLLQQILFLRELGFELKQIQDIIKQGEFDKMKALQSHKTVIKKNIERLKTLLSTIDNTLHHLERKQLMNPQELFYGFDSEKQKKYAAHMNDYLAKKGSHYQKSMDESLRNTGSWSPEEWQQNMSACTLLNEKFVKMLEEGLQPHSKAVQTLVQEHYEWIKKFWTPNKESYKGLGQLYKEHADFRKFYSAYHPDLAEFLAAAMRIFADANLQ